MNKDMSNLMEENRILKERLATGIKMYQALAKEHEALIQRFNGAVKTYRQQQEEINNLMYLLETPELTDWNVPSNCNKLVYYKLTIERALKQADVKNLNEFRFWLETQDCPNKPLAVRAYNELNK